jgi:hypothetical protein
VRNGGRAHSGHHPLLSPAREVQRAAVKWYECRRFEARASPDPDALSRDDPHLVGTLPMPSMNRK